MNILLSNIHINISVFKCSTFGIPKCNISISYKIDIHLIWMLFSLSLCVSLRMRLVSDKFVLYSVWIIKFHCITVVNIVLIVTRYLLIVIFMVENVVLISVLVYFCDCIYHLNKGGQRY